MKTSLRRVPFQFVLCLVMLLTVGRVFASEPSLTKAQAIELANAEAQARKMPLDHYQPPTATYYPEEDTWHVAYGSKSRKPGDLFEVFVNDKTKETKFIPGP